MNETLDVVHSPKIITAENITQSHVVAVIATEQNTTEQGTPDPLLVLGLTAIIAAVSVISKKRKA